MLALALAALFGGLVGAIGSWDASGEAPTPAVPTVLADRTTDGRRGGTGVTAFPTLLDRYDLDRPAASFDLPGRLDEVSGLAFSPDGRLFAHDDERGRIHEIDPASGEVGDRFDLGDDMARADFEGLAIAGERFFLITSRGLLYEFREAADREATAYRVTDTRAGARCEMEGLDFDPTLDALLLPCKVSSPDDGTVVLHRLPLDPGRSRLDPIRVRKADLAAHGIEPEFDPAAVAVDPTGTLVLVSGRQEVIVEIDRTGRVLAAARLSGDRHRQTEGIAFGPDGTLYLADESNDGDARLTAYAPRGTRGGAAR